MNFENDNEQRNFLAYKSLGDQMAFLALGLGNEEPPSKNNKDDNKDKIKNLKGSKDLSIMNNNYPKIKYSIAESESKFQNINNISNNSINKIRKSQMPFNKNSSHSSSVNYPFFPLQPNNIQSSPRHTKLLMNNINTYDNLYNYDENEKNQNNSRSNESYSNNMPEIELLEVEKINTEEIEEEPEGMINPFTQDKIITKSRQHTIYERAMKNLKKKETKINKERNLIIEKKLRNMKSIPEMNKKSIELLIKKGEYIPIENRAAQLHNHHLTQILLNEELNRIEKENLEEKELKNKVNKNRKYQEKEWNEFVEKCFEWKKNVIYKRKANEIYRYKRDKQINYKPLINENSKRIMRKIINKNNSSFDDVFTRLYNDYEEHKERQKILDEKYSPPFNPMINNFHFSKNFRENKKYRNNSYDNSYEIFVTDGNKSNFFLESQVTINDGKMLKKHKKAMKFVNKKKENKKNKNDNNINYNKSYKPTQATNNTTSYMNTEMNANRNKYKKYVPTEKNITTETNLNTNQNYLITDINTDNKMITEMNDNNNISNYEVMNNDERILKELDEAKLLNKEKNEKEKENNDDSLYKINVMESTPQSIKQNVIIPSNKYQNFFDIEEINEL